jgi:hypothetical protein
MAKQMHRWRVVKMKAKGEEVCTIEALDAETAIALAIERYQAVLSGCVRHFW